MSKFCIVILLVLTSTFLAAEDRESPIDTKYRSISEEKFQLLTEAKVLLDNYRGNTNDLNTSKKLLESILQQDSLFTPAYVEYGRLAIKSVHNNYDKNSAGALSFAEKIIYRAIEIEPEYADAYTLLGHLYTGQKRYLEAENALKTADKIGTGNPWLHINWGDLLSRQKKRDEAIARYMMIYEKGTSNRSAMAYTLLQLGTQHKYLNTIEARSWYKRLVKFEPTGAWHWQEYSKFLLFWDADVDEAIISARKSLEIMDFGAGRFTLACALYAKWAALTKEGNINEANQYFDEAKSLYPDTTRVLRLFNRYPGTVTARKILSEYQADN